MPSFRSSWIYHLVLGALSSYFFWRTLRALNILGKLNTLQWGKYGSQTLPLSYRIGKRVSRKCNSSTLFKLVSSGFPVIPDNIKSFFLRNSVIYTKAVAMYIIVKWPPEQLSFCVYSELRGQIWGTFCVPTMLQTITWVHLRWQEHQQLVRMVMLHDTYNLVASHPNGSTPKVSSFKVWTKVGCSLFFAFRRLRQGQAVWISSYSHHRSHTS